MAKYIITAILLALSALAIFTAQDCETIGETETGYVSPIDHGKCVE